MKTATAPALVQCYACKREISEHAATCPHCGQPHGAAAGFAGKRPLTRGEKIAVVAGIGTLGAVVWYLAATGHVATWLN